MIDIPARADIKKRRFRLEKRTDTDNRRKKCPENERKREKGEMKDAVKNAENG